MMSTFLSTRASSRNVIGHRPGASPIDHALTLLLADETEAALRWGAAALERDPLSPSALIVTSRLLDQMGRTRAATDGLRLASQRALEMGDLPVALAAIDDLRILGADAGDQLDQAANAFCRGSPRLQEAHSPLPQPRFGDFVEPLSPFLSGPPLASRATQILVAAKEAHDEAIGSHLPALASLPMFSALSWESLRDLLSAFQMITVPAGHPIVREGEEGTAAYIVAQGEVELSRRAAPGDNKPRLTAGRLGSGAFFGEMALLSRLPSATTATSTRPTILLVGRRDALVSLATRRPEVAVQLSAHCRRTSLANLGWTSPVVTSLRTEDCETLVERLEMRVFERGEKLVRDREEPKGLHLIVSGEVAVVAREWSERVLLASLGAGETVGEVELVLCRQAYADAVAVRPTAALFLSRDEYSALVQDRPAILHGLYATAVRRHAETRLALESGSSAVDDDCLVDDDVTVTRVVSDRVLQPQRLVAVAAPRPEVPRAQHRAPLYPSEYDVREVANEMPPPPRGAVGSSVAPITSSVPPRNAVPLARRPSLQLTAMAAVSLAASAAGVLAVLALHSGHAATAVQPMGTAASVPAISAAPTAAESPAVAQSAWAPSPSVKPVIIRRVLVRPTVPKPRIVVAAQPTESATASQAPVAAPSASVPDAPAPSATALRLSTRAAPTPEEFGGRE
jgi:cAMP-dependent protein kinase regulator